MKINLIKSLTTFAAVALAMGVGTPGHAWQPALNEVGAPIKQPSKTVSYSINTAGAAPGFAKAVQSALQSWSTLPGADIAYTFEGTTDAPSQQDFKNVVTWNTTGAGLSPETLGIAITYTYQDGRIAEFDMEFNGTHLLTTDGSRDGSDIQSIALHEAGHAIGFGHEDVLPSVMKSTLTQGDVKRVLFDTDIAGAQTLYPGEGCLGSRKGDVNGDNTIDITDAVTVLQLSVGLRALDNACTNKSADTNANGRIQIDDAISILRNAVMGEPFPG